jgi:acyl transferase domain-containing protein
MGGANAHVIIDSATPTPQTNGFHTFTLDNNAHTNGNLLNGAHTKTNGTYLNGTSINETHTNGTQTNGTHVNGNASNGTRTNGVHTNGTITNHTLTNGNSNGFEGKEQRLLVFSANSEGSLKKMISNYKDFLENQPFKLSDLAHTLSVRRHHWNIRSFAVTDGKTLNTVPGSRISKFKGLLFIFTGQGAQWAGMGRELIRDFSSFREDIRKMDGWLAESSHPPGWKIEGISTLRFQLCVFTT